MTLLSEPRPFTATRVERQLSKPELARLLAEAAANTAALPVEDVPGFSTAEKPNFPTAGKSKSANFPTVGKPAATACRFKK